MNFHILHYFIEENEERVQYNEISKRSAHIREQNEIFELPKMNSVKIFFWVKKDLKYYTIKFGII